MKTFHLDVVSAESRIFSGSVKNFLVTACMGDIGVFYGHTALLTKLLPGRLRILKANFQEEFIYVSGGVLEIQPTISTLLADTAIRGQDLDLQKVESVKKKAEKMMTGKGESVDIELASSELEKAVAQLRVLELSKRFR
ncbi:ATP synthase epsilon chain [Candidatus Photodesmus katoptron]|uniref:ATP synthase epsilon chain n=1 Tax=Candidatus Photodesmus katoptron Akat1 TaxID=1236703 RepID=S3EH76_9GAMM|nr:ATP synthase F1, epsilon subunit [Candidatus Photodesmus katoptron Akat1]KEY90193.1 ATP synthase epsilon chain [Candidatus Photodesmus katoptron]